MSNLHDAIVDRICDLYDQGLEAVDIFEQLDERVSMRDIYDTIELYIDSFEPEEEYYA